MGAELAARIEFYRVEDPYGFLSNFYEAPITLKGRLWPTSEHYFQAQKFEGTPREEEILMRVRAKLRETG